MGDIVYIASWECIKMWCNVQVIIYRLYHYNKNFPAMRAWQSLILLIPSILFLNVFIIIIFVSIIIQVLQFWINIIQFNIVFFSVVKLFYNSKRMSVKIFFWKKLFSFQLWWICSAFGCCRKGDRFESWPNTSS